MRELEDDSTFKAAESLAEQIARHVGRQIITGDLVEGERIQELRIASELSVSRGSVREALLILERRHLIHIYPRRGAVVAEMSAQQIKSLFEVVTLLLSVLVRRAADNWRQADVEGFTALLEKMQQMVRDGDIEGFYENSFAFFRLGYRFSMNPYIEEMLEDLQPALQRGYYLALHTNKRELQEAFNFFKGVMESVLLRKGDQAADLIADFCLHLRNLVLDSLARMKQIELAWAARSRR
jgi:DNA-binding GntR family transcriptional regulator